MNHKTLRNAVAAGVLAVVSGYAIQASALPTFTFSERGGFQSGTASGPALIFFEGGPCAGALCPATWTNAPAYATGIAPPAGLQTWSKMSWNQGEFPTSFLELQTFDGALAALAPGPGVEEGWSTISTIKDTNNIIPTATDWFGQALWGRFILTDTTPVVDVIVVDDNDKILLDYKETSNQPTTQACKDIHGPTSNPNNSLCDDRITFSSAALDDINFAAADGTLWTLEFRFAKLENAIADGNQIYTAENATSTLDIQARVIQRREVAEPSTLTLIGLGLLGLGFVGRRRQRGSAA